MARLFRRGVIVCPQCGHEMRPRAKRPSGLDGEELLDWIMTQTVEVEGPHDTPCLVWQGVRQHQGYGQMGHRGKTQMVHRVVYRLCFGLPKGVVVMHDKDCDKGCCNPKHLKLGTQKANVRESMALGTYRASQLRR